MHLPGEGLIIYALSRCRNGTAPGALEPLYHPAGDAGSARGRPRTLPAG